MAPKKTGKQKMSLNEFLGDSALGSWADEMDAIPSAPAARDDDSSGRGGRDDFLSSRPDRGFNGPPREDLPMPTQPPYTAFIGNLSFDIQESELESFFAPSQTKSVKIIKDRDERPKGFGYIEFADLDGLKDGLSRTGTSLAGRTIRVSVAEPPKERSGFGGGGGFDDEAKFDNPWRRDGPLPDLPGRGDRDSRRPGPGRFEGDRPERVPPPPSVAEGINDWRSAQSPRAAPAGLPDDGPKRRGSGFRSDAPPGAADTEEVWSKGSRFKPSEDRGGPGGGFGGRRGDMGPPAAPKEPEGDWRGAARPRLASRDSTSPSSSTPPTPTMGRRRLELLPRSTTGSAAPSPLSSPKIPPAQASTPRSNPFGEARPVDVSNREAAITERLEKDREAMKDRPPHPMSRTQSGQVMQRGDSGHSMSRTGSRTGEMRGSVPSTPTSRTFDATSASVRPAISFAKAARKEDGGEPEEVAEKLGEATI